MKCCANILICIWAVLALTDKLVLEIDQKMTWIFHGDVFDNTTKGSARLIAKLGSNGYGMLILFNRLVNTITGFYRKRKNFHFQKSNAGRKQSSSQSK